MRKLGVIIFLFIVFGTVSGQVRNGWRSIFDKEGRLTRMYFYNNGISKPDSNRFYQYYTENLLKAMIIGEIEPQGGKINGAMSLFDYSGQLTSYSTKKQNYSLFEMNCDYDGNCTAVWRDQFEVNSGTWNCKEFSIQHGDFILHNDSAMGYAIYEPEFPVDLFHSFACKIVIPVDKNTAKQGLALGWLDENNYCMFEISFGKYYSIVYWRNGEYYTVTEGRQVIERPDPVANELVLRKNDKNLLLEINGVIEKVLPCHALAGDKIALVTRSKGDAHFSDFGFSYQLQPNDPFFEKLWIGKGTGFFISPTKILTTYDVVMDAKNLQVVGKIDNVVFKVPVKVIRLEEENNLAILMVDDPSFSGPEKILYGFTDHVPVSESAVFSLGYPNAISGIYMFPDMFEGKVLPSSAAYSGIRLLEMPFRHGMTGAPVFDNDANLVGVCSIRGVDLRYTEIIDFYDNSRLFRANMGQMDRKLVSPIKDKSRMEKIKALSQMVVLIESSVFDIEK